MLNFGLLVAAMVQAHMLCSKLVTMHIPVSLSFDQSCPEIAPKSMAGSSLILANISIICRILVSASAH